MSSTKKTLSAYDDDDDDDDAGDNADDYDDGDDDDDDDDDYCFLFCPKYTQIWGSYQIQHLISFAQESKFFLYLSWHFMQCQGQHQMKMSKLNIHAFISNSYLYTFVCTYLFII